MNVTDLTKQYGQNGIQLGNKLLYLTSDGISETVHGYVIAVYDNDMTPKTVYSDIHETAPMTPEIKTWDDAQDALFGAPDKPDFGKQLIKG